VKTEAGLPRPFPWLPGLLVAALWVPKVVRYALEECVAKLKPHAVGSEGAGADSFRVGTEAPRRRRAVDIPPRDAIDTREGAVVARSAERIPSAAKNGGFSVIKGPGNINSREVLVRRLWYFCCFFFFFFSVKAGLLLARLDFYARTREHCRRTSARGI